MYPVPDRDMTGGFPVVVALGMCQDFAGSAPTVPVPVVLQFSTYIPSARGVGRHCLTGSAHRLRDLIPRPACYLIQLCQIPGKFYRAGL